MKRIILRADAGSNSWMANFLNDAAVKALFGTTEIPTPYTLKMPVEAVLANIRQRNPQCEVSAL